MNTAPTRANHPAVAFHRFLHTPLCRATARVLTVALVLADFPVERVTATSPPPPTPPSSPTILYVNNTDPTCQGKTPCFPKIQAAVDAATPGATLRVQAGTYPEPVSINNKNKRATTESQRIVLEADPAAPLGSVVLRSAQSGPGDAIVVENSRFITLRGLTITNARGRAILLAGGSKNANTAIHLERNRLVGNGTTGCRSAILVRAGNTETLIANNLIYSNGRNGVRVSRGVGGPHSLVSNTLHGNGRNGVRLGKGPEVELVNNIITGNGAAVASTGQLRCIDDPGEDEDDDDEADAPLAAEGVGVRRLATGSNSYPGQAQLLKNLICGNARGELSGAILDSTDSGNLTPTGTEGPGVQASPGCQVFSQLYAHLAGPDGQLNTTDDDFSLLPTAPAIDTGTDPRRLALGVDLALLTADFTGDGHRPQDGNGDGMTAFDMGALEAPGRQCQQGATATCYDGPAGTQGVGLCHGGTKTCTAQGQWGACQNQVLPQAEVCNGKDDNCNGQVDEGVCPANHLPTITSTPVTTGTVGQAYNYTVTATDPDAGDTLTYSLTTFPTGMTINSGTGLFAWTPTTGQTGAQSVTVQVSDGKGGTANQSFTIQVAVAVNHPPVAQDDQYAVRHQQTLTVAAPGVLQNDSDPDGQSLIAKLVTGPAKGALNLAADGSLTYTPTDPPPGSNEPILKFSFTDPVRSATSFTVNQPVVVDLDKDGSPEIVFISWKQFTYRRLVAVHGNDGSQAFSIDVYQPTANPPLVLSQEALAVGDLDGDGFPEIVTVLTDPVTGGRSQLIAFNHDGTVKWRGQSVIDDPLVDTVSSSGSGSFTKPLIADIDGDGKPEIVIGYTGTGPTAPGFGAKFVTVFDNQGRILWTAQGSNPNPGSGTVVAQDIDLDGNLEIIFQNDVFDNRGALLWSATDGSFESALNDVAVANLDDDPFAEIVYLDIYNQLYVYEHTGVRKWGPVAAGPFSADIGSTLLTIGDVDGDGLPEIVVMGDNSIAAVKRDGTVRTLPLPFSTATPSVGRTVAIFDLNGDGKPEIMYTGVQGPSDNLGTLFILDGQTGALLHSIASPRVSIDGSPIIADVDGDGTAEIVTPGSGGDDVLLRVFTAKTGPWAQARPVYNQFSYHITNVNNDGTIPVREAINWLTPGLNNYRINIPLPQERTGDKDAFTYKATDGALDSNTATVRIDILPPNHAPRIVSQPPTTASPTIQYVYAVRAVDPDVGEVLIFSLAQAPTGMTIDAATGLIRWTPTAAQVGNFLMTVKVTDSQGQSDFQGFTIAVAGAVTVPKVVGQTQAAAQTAIAAANLTIGTITTTPSSTVPVGRVMSQEPAAGTTVPSGSAVNLVISSGQPTVTVPNVVGQPQAGAQTAITGANLTVGTVTASPSTTVPAGNVISQDPTASTVVPGGTAVNLIVSLGAISISGLTSIVVAPTTPLILVGQQQAFTATGVFADGTSLNLTGLAGWSSSNSAVASIVPGGVATGAADGTTTIQANVNGINGSITLTVRAQVAGDTTAPTATITAPAGGAEVTSPVNVVGTASDTNFLKYVLEYAPAGGTTFTLLAQGTTSVTNGVLGILDPTLLINDQYTLRLTVFDRGGNTTVASVTVQVTREQKVGLFTVTFQDLSIPLSGLPITINRTYDSRDKGQGDFGIGWRLNIQTLHIRANRVQGDGWQVNKSGLTYTLVPLSEHKVSLTLPDGKVEEFDLAINPSSSAIVPLQAATASYMPRTGTLGTLIRLDNTGILIADNEPGPVTLLDDTTLNTFDPQRFRYIAADGRMIDLDKTKGVQAVRDPNGNVLTFGTNGITHSAGKSVTFTRDAQGRITQITDPAGNVQQYAYNANGDLISHTDPVGNVSRYSYNSTHGLIDIRDPAGNHAARNEYDAQGRLIATTDAQGNRIEFTHDTAASREVVRDRLGNPTVFEYDATGNVTAKTDALGNRTTYLYDSQGNQLAETDPLGRIARKTYDAQRNVLTSTDFDSNTTTYTYNARQQVLTSSDPEGRTITNVYDANGNLTQVTDPEGGVTRHTYDAAGNQLTTTDPLGNVTTFTYDAFGHKTSETDPLGTLTTFTNDTNGNVLSTTKAGTQTTQFQYDAAQRLTRTTDALGHQSNITYSALRDGQKLASTTNANGGVTTFAYDVRGNLISKTFPDGSAETMTYDAENHVLSQTDRDGHTTAFQYDALGRQTRITNPDGTTILKTYDAVGRLLTQTDERGNGTTYSYAPNKQTVTDALGNVTVHEFDSQRRRTKTTDTLGHVITFAYDSKGNLTRTTFPNGTSKTTTYDTAGRKTAETDQAGQTIQFAYDALGRLIRVPDAAGGITK